MNKKLVSIVSGLMFLAIALVILLIILLCSNKIQSLPVSETFSARAEDISMEVGEKVFNFYEVNGEDVSVSFKVDKEGIINIDENKIEGISAGKVKVTLNARILNGSKVCNFEVKVYAKNFKISIIPVLNCEVDSSMKTLTLNENCCLFRVEVFDKLNQKLEDFDINFISSKEDVVIEKEFINIILQTKESCELTIKINDNLAIFRLNVIYNNVNS